VGGGFGQWKGGRAVPLANGCEHGDVRAVQEGDVVGLASARSAGEGRVEREMGSVCVFSSLFRFRVWMGWAVVCSAWARFGREERVQGGVFGRLRVGPEVVHRLVSNGECGPATFYEF
jgi:hypothetical protein